jgi:cation diffusion facilitator family transporter
MSQPSLAKLSVYVALGSNLAVAAIKLAAAAVTGSSAMASEGVHSIVDTLNEGLLLYGAARASRPADVDHPFGHGRELYFWSFLVALLVLVLGAAVAFYQGWQHLLEPQPIHNVIASYVVLGASFVFEGVSWLTGFKAFRAANDGVSYFEAFRNSKDPTTFTVLFEDSAALIGLVIAALGIGCAHAFDAPRLDGIASLGIGGVLTVSSLLLARETKSLLIGEPASPSLRDAILRIVAHDPDIRRANGVLTVQLGPQQVVASFSVEFREGLSGRQLEDSVNRIEAAIKRAHPEVTNVFVKPQSAATWRERVARVASGSDERFWP